LELQGNSPLVGADLVSALFAIQKKYRVKKAKEKKDKYNVLREWKERTQKKIKNIFRKKGY